MIPNGEGWHYIAVEELLELLREITSKYHGLLEQKKNLNHINRYRKTKIFVMPSEGNKILKFNQYQRSDKAPFIIYAELECLIENTDWCKNNLQNLSTTKVGEHIPSSFFHVSNIVT